MAGFDDLARVFDKLGTAQLADVNQTILMHAQIHKCAKRRNIADDAFQNHTGCQVFNLRHAAGKGGGFEFGARIPTWLFQFFQNIAHGGRAEIIIGVFVRAERAQKRDVADQAFKLPAGSTQNALHYRVTFWMHARGIQRIRTITNAQKPGALFERFNAQPWHVL